MAKIDGTIRRSGMAMLLAAILFGLCWAVPGTATPVAFFGVSDFDASAAPAFGRSRVEPVGGAAVAIAGLLEPAGDVSAPSDFAVAVDLLRFAAVPDRAAVAQTSGLGTIPAGSPYKARAPPRHG